MEIFENAIVYLNDKLLKHHYSKKHKNKSVLILKKIKRSDGKTTGRQYIPVVPILVGKDKVNNYVTPNDLLYFKEWFVDSDSLYGVGRYGDIYVPYLTTVKSGIQANEEYLDSVTRNISPLNISEKELTYLNNMTNRKDKLVFKQYISKDRYISIDYSCNKTDFKPYLSIQYVYKDTNDSFLWRNTPDMFLNIYHKEINQILYLFGKKHLKTLTKTEFNELVSLVNEIIKKPVNKSYNIDLNNINIKQELVDSQTKYFLIENNSIFQKDDIIYAIDDALGKRDAYFFYRKFFSTLSRELNLSEQSLGSSNIAITLIEKYFS